MQLILVDAINSFIVAGKINEEMFKLLESFNQSKVIVSNVNDEERKERMPAKLPYDLFTLEHNPNKTDPEYFKQLLQQYHITEDQVIYFDHNEEAVKSARSVGIKSHHYNPSGDISELKFFLYENIPPSGGAVSEFDDYIIP